MAGYYQKAKTKNRETKKLEKKTTNKQRRKRKIQNMVKSFGRRKRKKQQYGNERCRNYTEDEK